MDQYTQIEISEHKINHSRDFIDHWKVPDQGCYPSPDHAPHPLTNKQISCDNWLQSKDNSFIYIPKSETENSSLPSYFYCSLHNKWLRLGNTIGNVNKHIQSSHKAIKTNQVASVVAQNIVSANNNGQFNEHQKKIIANAVKSFIVSQGYSFNSIQNPYLKNAFEFLGNRADFRDETCKAAEGITNSIRSILSNSSFISLAFDEWSDISENRFIGVTAKALHQKQIEKFVLALKQLPGNKATADNIAQIYNEVTNKYEHIMWHEGGLFIFN